MPWGETLAVTMEIGFTINQFTLDSSLLDSVHVLDGTKEAVPVETFVQDIQTTRGRSDQLQNFTAGTCTLVLLNNDRRFDPINSASPYWDVSKNQSGVVPRRKVVVTSGSTIIFSGDITDVDISYQKGITNISTVDISVADDFVRLANAFTGAAFTPSAELSGARATRILHLAAVDYSALNRTVSSGVATLGEYEIPANSNALTYLQNCADAEQNFCFMSADGMFTFTDRIANEFAAVVVAFTDTGAGIGYQELSVVYGQELLYNRVQCTTADADAVVQTQSDTPSQTAYGISTLVLDGLLLSTDAAADALAVVLLERYKNPVYRFDGMDVILNGLSTVNRNLVVGLELGDTISIERTFSTGTPVSVTKMYKVTKIAHKITAGTHTVSFGLAVINIVYPWTLDDPIFSVLDSSNAYS